MPPTAGTRPTLAAARAAIQAGRLKEADAMYRALAEARPGDPAILADRGVLALRQGDLSTAVDHLAAARRAAPDNPELAHMLGAVYLEAGRPADAIPCFEAAIAKAPRSADSHFSLANALAAERRMDDALRHMQAAVELAPRDVEAWLNLGNLRRDCGDKDGAAQAYRKALAVDNDYIPAMVNLGETLVGRGEAEEAHSLFERALNIAPDLPEAQNGMAAALIKLNRAGEAVAFAERAAVQRPKAWRPWLTLGEARYVAGDYRAAAEAFGKAAAINPRSQPALVGLGLAALDGDMTAEAEEAFQRVLDLDGEQPDALAGMGVLLQRSGRFAEAAAYLNRALKAAPSHAAAMSALLKTPQDGDSGGLIDAAETVLAGDTVTPAQRADLEFSVGHAYDAAGDFAAAFDHFKRGNDLRRAQMPFDSDAHAAFVAATIDSFNATLMASLTEAGIGHESTRPVFVVGMPRSGTTLIEQVIASHPEAAGAGELPTIREIGGKLKSALPTDRPYPMCIDQLTAKAVATLAPLHLDRLAETDGAARRVVDKMPNNFLRLGLIGLFFPNAKIVHVTRDARDTALSCYKQNFATGVRFSYSPEDIVAYYRAYRHIMTHWRAVLPMPMLEVVYETLVDDTEAEARRLIDFLGLDWHEACLDFHRTERTVKTASLWQVRQPVYRSSVGGWQNYQPYLGTMFDALAAIDAAAHG